MNVEIKDNIIHSTIHWNELIKKYKEIADSGNPFKNRTAADFIDNQWKKGTSFVTCDFSAMIERLEKGYRFPIVDLPTLPIVAYDRPRPRFTDDPEGEFDNDMFNNGETEYFLSKPKKKSVGGIRLRIQMNFSGMISHELVSQYLLWVGQVIQAIQARGYDLEITVFSNSNRVYVDKNAEMDIHNIILSKFGERVIFKDWSALFSPGGFRHFMFLFYMWVGETENFRYNSGLGRPLGKGWGVNWQPEDRVLEITTHSGDRNFPSEQMTKELEDWKE